MSGFQLPPIHDSWEEDINQGMRMGEVIAVDGERGQFLWEYEMPKGTTALVLYQANSECWWRVRTVPYGALSDRWMRLIEEEGVGLDCMVANPQAGNQRWVKRLAEFKAKHPELFAEVTLHSGAGSEEGK